jgi:hypothetical protein
MSSHVDRDRGLKRGAIRSDGVRAPLNTHCTALDGPAAVRISNA